MQTIVLYAISHTSVSHRSMVCSIAMVSIHPYKNLLSRKTIKMCTELINGIRYTIENEILILLSAMEISFYEAGNLVLVVGDVCS